MTAIVAVELRRALSRRLVRVLVLVSVLVIAALAIGAFVTSDPGAADAFSAGDIWTTDENADSDVGIVGAMSLLFLLMGLIVGASAVGAEYKAGTITALLTWEPRRAPVLAAKLLVAGLVAGVLFVGLCVLLGVALAPAAVVRGTTDGFDGEFFGTLGGYLARGALVTAWLSIVAASVATLGRNTSAALGAVFGYFVVVENVLRLVRPGWNAWYLPENFFTVLGNEKLDDVARSVGGAVAVLGAYLGVAVAAAMLTFLRRDVT